MPYTECKLSVTEQNIKETRLAPQTFTERRCSKSQRKIPHKKLLPECRNVTKANCVLTNWETDNYGNQVREDVNIKIPKNGGKSVKKWKKYITFLDELAQF